LSYPGTDVFLVCYSVINPVSLVNIRFKWIPEIVHYAPNIPYVLCGTKIDLRGDPSTLANLQAKKLYPLSFEDGIMMAKEVGAAAYIECSALCRFSNHVFYEIARIALRPYMQKNFNREKNNCLLQ